MGSQTRTGGQLLVESLLNLGACHGFGVPGESYLAVLDALHDAQNRFQFVICRHEGGAGFAAAAYGKLMGVPGLAFVTRGPGATNASIGVHTAMQDSAPMILFVGQVGQHQQGREAFQEVDYRAFFGPIAKWATEITAPDRVPEVLQRAWTTAISGRPGPVVVALPEDVLSGTTSADPLSAPIRIAEAAPGSESLGQIAAALAGAEHPLIIAGGGGWRPEGRAALQSLAETAQIPVTTAFRYNDLIDNRSPVYAGDAGVGMPGNVRSMIETADAILALNIRFGEMTTDAYRLFGVPKPRQRILHVHASADEIGKIYTPEIAVQAGPNAFALALAYHGIAPSPSRGVWAKACHAGFLASLEAPSQPSPVDMAQVTVHLQKVLPENAILTNGAGNFTAWPNKFFAYGPDQTLLAPQSGAMGYGLPAAIAAKVAHPDRLVLCFAGDGDLQMQLAELGTAAQAGSVPIILVLNNGSYGTIRMHQERHFPGRVSGTGLQNPDFSTIAQAYGIHGERVETTDDFEAAFARAMASPTGTILDLNTSLEAITATERLSDLGSP